MKKILLLLLLFFIICLIFTTGCSPSKKDITISKVETYIRKPFNEDNFKNEGATNEKDAWGSDIVWGLASSRLNYILIVRSPGSDKLLYTSDDIVAKRYYSKHGDLPELAEALSRSINRGKVKGIKEGLLE